MNEFATLSYIISYPGIIFLVWILVQFAKNLFDRLKPENKTRYVVLDAVIILVSIRTTFLIAQLEVYNFESVATLIVEWLINIPLIWFAVMKAHEVIIEKK